MQMIVNHTNLMPYISRYGLSASLGTLGARVTFTMPTDSTASQPPSVALGDPVRLYDSEFYRTIFDGIVTARRYTDTTREITAYDFCYYLNKSQICMQFPEQRTDRAIAQMWDYLGIKRTNLPRMQGVISAVTYVKTPSEILRALLEFEQDVSGVEYFAVASGYGKIDIQPVGYYRTGIALEAVSSPVLSDSLDDVRNRIYYAIKSDDTVSVTAEAADEVSIARYGQIAEYIVDSAEPIYTATIAQNRLAQKRIPLQSGEITVLGNWQAQIGRTIAVEDKVTGLAGDYILDTVTHDVTDGLHLMTLGLAQRVTAA